MLTPEERERLDRLDRLARHAEAQHQAALNVLTPGCYGALVMLANRYAGQK